MLKHVKVDIKVSLDSGGSEQQEVQNWVEEVRHTISSTLLTTRCEDADLEVENKPVDLNTCWKPFKWSMPPSVYIYQTKNISLDNPHAEIME